MPTAADLAGSFWDGVEVADAYVSATSAVTESVVSISDGRLRAWTLQQTDVVIGSTFSGNIAFGYPRPLRDPLWIAQDLLGSNVLTYRQDFDFDDAYVWFDADPLQWATLKQLNWVNGAPVVTVTLFYCSAVEPTPALPPAATYGALTNAIATTCDSPAAVGGDTVQAIFQNFDSTTEVITDRQAYRLASTDTPSVAVGALLLPGQPVGSAWTLTRLGRQSPTIPYFTTPQSYQQGVTTSGGITYYNTTVPLIVDEIGGRTRVRWELGAATQADCDAYWTASHATGTAPGAKSLAQAMDLRSNPVGDPDASSLPTTVNPLAFACSNLFNDNAYYLSVNVAACGPNATDDATRQRTVQQAAGPYTAVFEYLNAMPALTERTPS